MSVFLVARVLLTQKSKVILVNPSMQGQSFFLLRRFIAISNVKFVILLTS